MSSGNCKEHHLSLSFPIHGGVRDKKEEGENAKKKNKKPPYFLSSHLVECAKTPRRPLYWLISLREVDELVQPGDRERGEGKQAKEL